MRSEVGIAYTSMATTTFSTPLTNSRAPLVSSQFATNNEPGAQGAHNAVFDNVWWGDLQIDNMEFSPRMLETLSQLEPLNTGMDRDRN